jgi:hypothetical protein
MNPVLEKIQKGMRVFDQDQNDIGSVDYVKFGDEDPTQPGAETADVSPAQHDTSNSFVENVFDIFSPDDIPDELQARLLREGFVRVDSESLFHSDRYILPSQIQSVSVSDKSVRLKVSKSALVKRSE